MGEPHDAAWGIPVKSGIEPKQWKFGVWPTGPPGALGSYWTPHGAFWGSCAIHMWVFPVFCMTKARSRATCRPERTLIQMLSHTLQPLSFELHPLGKAMTHFSGFQMLHNSLFLVLSVDNNWRNWIIYGEKYQETPSLHHPTEYSTDQFLKLAPSLISYCILREFLNLSFLSFPNNLLFLGCRDRMSMMPGTHRSLVTARDG